MKLELRIIDVFFIVALAFLFGFATGRCFGQSPATEMKVAADDAEKLGAIARQYQYFTLYGVPEEDREALVAALNYSINFVSRSRVVVPGERINATMMRFNLGQYIEDKEAGEVWAKVFEMIGNADRAFKIETEIVDNKTLPAGTKQGSTPATKLVTVDGGWVGLENAKRLFVCTTRTASLMRAEHFVFEATKPSAYHDLAGIGATEDEFFKSIGVDFALVRKLRSTFGANLAKSNVTNFERSVESGQGPFGAFFITLDTNKADAAHSFLRRPTRIVPANVSNEPQPESEASEIFADAPNRFYRVAIYAREKNAKGELVTRRIDKVDDEIAKDTSEPLGDGIIRTGASCVRCHAVDGGLRTFEDSQTKLRYSSTNPLVTSIMQGFYQPNRIYQHMRSSTDGHAEAVEQATGMKFQKAMGSFASSIRNHAYVPVGLNRVARLAGLSPEEMLDALGTAKDPNLIRLRDGETFRLGSIESNLPEAMTAADSYRAAHQKGDKE